MATKRQRNHAVKVYYEQFFKQHPEELSSPEGYKVVPWYTPQGKREGKKYNIWCFSPTQLSYLYTDNPYVHFGKVTVYLNYKDGKIVNLNSGETFKYDESLKAYKLVPTLMK